MLNIPDFLCVILHTEHFYNIQAETLRIYMIYRIIYTHYTTHLLTSRWVNYFNPRWLICSFRGLNFNIKI